MKRRWLKRLLSTFPRQKLSRRLLRDSHHCPMQWFAITHRKTECSRHLAIGGYSAGLLKGQEPLFCTRMVYVRPLAAVKRRDFRHNIFQTCTFGLNSNWTFESLRSKSFCLFVSVPISAQRWPRIVSVCMFFGSSFLFCFFVEAASSLSWFGSKCSPELPAACRGFLFVFFLLACPSLETPQTHVRNPHSWNFRRLGWYRPTGVQDVLGMTDLKGGGKKQGVT